MYSVRFYKDKNGNMPLKDFLSDLGERKDKNSRVNYNKIRDYIKILSIYGTSAGEPYMKRLDDEIWELRPLRNRILFFGYDGEHFILLSHFIKKTQKTPKREIDKAKRLMKDYMERGADNEN